MDLGLLLARQAQGRLGAQPGACGWAPEKAWGQRSQEVAVCSWVAGPWCPGFSANPSLFLLWSQARAEASQSFRASREPLLLVIPL